MLTFSQRLLLITFCSLNVHVAICMQEQRPVVPILALPQITVPIHSSPSIKLELKRLLTIAAAADKVKIYSDMFVFTDKEIYTPLFQIAGKRDNKVSLHLHESHASNKNIISLITQFPNITLKTGKQHGKRTMIKFKNNDESVWHRVVLEGSYNPSPNAEKKNAEISLISYEQPEYYRKHKASHKNGLEKPYRGAQVLALTPREQEVCDTTQYDLCTSLAGRVHPDHGGTLYMGTMGYNHPVLHRKLLEFCRARGTVHLLVDYKSINRVSQPLLTELHAAGAHVTVGNMTSTKKNPRGTFHKKYFVRLPDNVVTNLVVIQSANFTQEAHSDFNHASYHPGLPALGTSLINAHVADVAAGISFADFLARQAARPARVQPARAAKKA